MEGGGGGELGEVWFKPKKLSIIEGAGTTGLTAWIPPKDVWLEKKIYRSLDLVEIMTRQWIDNAFSYQ